MKQLNIVIDDENRYFAEGLRLSIEKYAQENSKTVCFLAQHDAEWADMVLASSRRRAQRWRRTRHIGVVIVKERRIFVESDSVRALYRTDDQSKLFELLNEVLSEDKPVPIRSLVLTCRERQVVGYLRCGFDQSQTARLLGLSVKTIHSHKRSIMSKLMLNRRHDFIYWLLSQEEESF